MPFFSKEYEAYRAQQQTAVKDLGFLPLGYHPDTRDQFHLVEEDRFSGTYIPGVQGGGKSRLLAWMFLRDAQSGHAAILFDPHGDLISLILACLPDDLLSKVFLLDMEDEAHPFGVNVFGMLRDLSSKELAKAIERVMHVFEVVWPETMKQQNLPRFLRAAVIALIANEGATLFDLHRFLLDDTFRASQLKNVTDRTVLDFWHTQFDEVPYNERMRRVQPLLSRLETLFMGRSLVRNIIGQRENTIDFKTAIEQKQLILIKLPKSLTQDARLTGTLLMAQIHSAVFSFADLLPDKRPSVSLYLDEFHHFVTPDIAEFFDQGRKFGVRLVAVHQYRGQLPDYLKEATMSARTKICLSLTPDDSKELAHVFPASQSEVKPEHIDPHPIAHLLAYGSDNEQVKDFTEWYLRPLLSQKHGQNVEIRLPKNRLATGFRFNPVGMLFSSNPLLWFYEADEKKNPVVADPTTYLDSLLYEVMKTGNPTLPISVPIVYGFSNGGRGFYRQFQRSLRKDWLLSNAVTYPQELVVEEPDGSLRWTRQPENSDEQLWHFIFHLRMTMKHLAHEPIGKRSEISHSEVAGWLNRLPRRAAFVRSGEDVGVIYTNDTPKPLTGEAFQARLQTVYEQTHAKYCRPKEEVERGLFGTTKDSDTPPEKPDEPELPIRRWEEL